MSVGAICFTSSGSNGGCWVVFVFPRPFLEKRGFFSHTPLTPKKEVYRTYTKKNFCRNKKRVTLISTIELRFPRVGCAHRIFSGVLEVWCHPIWPIVFFV